MSDGKKLVSAILIAGSVDTLRTLDEDALEPDELLFYAYVKQHYRQYGQLPTTATVEEALGARLVRATEPVGYYLKKVYDRKLFVEMRAPFAELRQALKTFDMDAARDIVAQMKTVCRTESLGTELQTLREAGDTVLAEYTDAHTRPGITGIPTGWPAFDTATGGYQNGDLVTYVARLNIGKTYTLLGQALHAWTAGYSVLVVTMEMTIVQMARRAMGIDAGVNPDYIRKGTLDTYTARRLRRYVDSMAHADRFNLYAGSFSKGVMDVEILMQELTPDIVFIDGAYILKPSTKRSMSRLERVPEVYDELKRLTITSDRPIINTTQFSRKAGKKGKDGDIESVAFSDAISTHSSIVCSIKEGRPPHQHTRRLIEIMKGREGESISVETNYSFNPMDFSEAALVGDEEAGAATDLDWTGE